MNIVMIYQLDNSSNFFYNIIDISKVEMIYNFKINTIIYLNSLSLSISIKT